MKNYIGGLVKYELISIARRETLLPFRRIEQLNKELGGQAHKFPQLILYQRPSYRPLLCFLSS